MKQGDRVKWVDGAGFEQQGTVDWEATQWNTPRVPIMCKDDVIRWIERYNLDKLSSTH